MTINILAFGIAKEITGGTSVRVQCEEGITAGGLKAILEEQYPRLKQLASFMIAVNGKYAGAGQVVRSPDEVAIIPPVSGG